MAKSTVASLDARITAAVAAMNNAIEKIDCLRAQVDFLIGSRDLVREQMIKDKKQRNIVLEQMIADPKPKNLTLNQMIAELPASLIGAARDNAITSLKRRIALRNKARNYN
jgi:hypothetical protein